MTPSAPIVAADRSGGGFAVPIGGCAALGAVGGLVSWAGLQAIGAPSAVTGPASGIVGALCAAAWLWRHARTRPGPPHAPAPPPDPTAAAAAGAPAAPGKREAADRVADRAVADRAVEERRRVRIDRMEAQARLAGRLAHDLNNHMGAIAGYADFLATDLPPGSTEADHARRILAAVDRARETLRRQVGITRIAAGALRPIRPLDLMADLLGPLRAGLPRSVALTVREAPDLPDLRGDGPLLVQALAALVDNARRAMDGSAEAALTLRTVLWPGHGEAAGGLPPGWSWDETLPPRRRPHILFEVRDSGPGVAQADLPRLFDPLVAGHDRNGRRGDGLGLAMVFAVLHGHDGGILIASRQGEGTLVRLFVPLADASPVSMAGGAAKASDGTVQAPVPLRCRILLVDGDAASGDRLSAGLERLGHEVAVCESVEEALAVFAEEPGAFDVVAAAAGFSGLPARLKESHPGIVCVLYGGPAPRVQGADLVLPAPVDVLLLGTRAAELAAVRREGRA